MLKTKSYQKTSLELIHIFLFSDLGDSWRVLMWQTYTAVKFIFKEDPPGVSS